MNPLWILGFSLLFIVLSFGTVTGLYQLDVLGLNLLDEFLGGNSDLNFLLMALGVVGVIYYLFFHAGRDAGAGREGSPEGWEG
jgi:hypothetical protein